MTATVDLDDLDLACLKVALMGPPVGAGRNMVNHNPDVARYQRLARAGLCTLDRKTIWGTDSADCTRAFTTNAGARLLIERELVTVKQLAVGWPRMLGLLKWARRLEVAPEIEPDHRGDGWLSWDDTPRFRAEANLLVARGWAEAGSPSDNGELTLRATDAGLEARR